MFSDINVKIRAATQRRFIQSLKALLLANSYIYSSVYLISYLYLFDNFTFITNNRKYFNKYYFQTFATLFLFSLNDIVYFRLFVCVELPRKSMISTLPHSIY